MADNEARTRLREQFLIGPTPENQPISRGTPVERESTALYRTFGESVRASIDQGLKTLPTSDVFYEALRIQEEEISRRAGERKLTPLEANQLYPFMGKPFTEDVEPGVAKLLAERQLEIRELQGVIDASNQGILAHGVRWSLQFGLGIFDPINYLTGRGIGSAIGWGAARFVAPATTRTFGFGLASTVAGNVVAEPLNAGARAQLGDEYDPLASVGYQALIGAGIHTAPHVIRGVVGYASPRLKSIMRSAPKADAIAANSAIASMDAGKNVNASRVVQDVLRERTVTPDPAVAPGSPRRIHDQVVDYRYVPITESSQYTQRPFYNAAALQNTSMENSTGHVVGRDLGPGFYLTDNPIEANAIAGSKYGHEGAGVFEVALTKKDLNIIDLNQPLPARAREILETYAEGWGGGKSDAEGLVGRPAGEVIDALQDATVAGRVPRDAIEEFNKSLQAAGFDGYRFDTGSGEAKANGVMLFDQANAAETSRFSPDESIIPKADGLELQSAIEELNSIRSDALYEQTAHERLTQLVSEPVEVQKLTDIEAAYNETGLEIREALKRKEIPESIMRDLEEIEARMKAGEEQDAIIKAAFACMSRNQ